MKNSPMRKHPPAVGQQAEMRVTWTESRIFCGPYPVAYKRFYKMETLRNAIGKALNERDRFLHTSVQAVLRGPLNALACDFVYEDATRLVFRITASSRARKRIVLRLVIAKNHEECSARLLEEYENLTVLHQRAAGVVIAPCGHGLLFLPDRHRRREVNREVFGYITSDVPGVAPLYVASNTQLAPHDTQPQRFSVKDSELLKAAVTRLMAKLYDERSATGFDPVRLYPECLAAGVNKNNQQTLVLMQCGRLRKRLRPQTLIHNLLFGVLKTDTTVFPLAPARPDAFFDALCRAVTPDTARAWCQSFLARAGKMDAHEHEELLPGREYLAALAELAKDI